MKDSFPVICNDGVERWYNKLGQLHRIDGPAVIYPWGEKMWYVKGKRIE